MVFKKKIDGRYRTCLVAPRYNQISWVEFIKNYSPVVTDVILRVILIMWLINRWYSQTIGVETEFLYVVLEEEI